eukprot:g14195.t1
MAAKVEKPMKGAGAKKQERVSRLHMEAVYHGMLNLTWNQLSPGEFPNLVVSQRERLGLQGRPGYLSYSSEGLCRNNVRRMLKRILISEDLHHLQGRQGGQHQKNVPGPVEVAGGSLSFESAKARLLGEVLGGQLLPPHVMEIIDLELAQLRKEWSSTPCSSKENASSAPSGASRFGNAEELPSDRAEDADFLNSSADESWWNISTNGADDASEDTDRDSRGDEDEVAGRDPCNSTLLDYRLMADDGETSVQVSATKYASSGPARGYPLFEELNQVTHGFVRRELANSSSVSLRAVQYSSGAIQFVPTLQQAKRLSKHLPLWDNQKRVNLLAKGAAHVPNRVMADDIGAGGVHAFSVENPELNATLAELTTDCTKLRSPRNQHPGSNKSSKGKGAKGGIGMMKMGGGPSSGAAAGLPLQNPVPVTNQYVEEGVTAALQWCWKDMAPNKSVQRKSYPPLENIPSVRRELVAFVGRRLALARSLYEKTVLHNDVEKHHLLLQQPADAADRQEMKEHLVDNEKTMVRCFPRLGFADVDATVRRLLLKVKARGATLRTHFPLYSPACCGSGCGCLQYGVAVGQL